MANAKRSLDAALDHFGVKAGYGQCRLYSHPERISVVAPMISDLLHKKGKTRIVIDYDPDYPYCLVREVTP